MKVLLLVVSFLVMFVGVLGCFLPLLPGPPVVFLGALIYSAFTRFEVVGARTLGILAVLTALGLLLDYLATAIGAKRLGASRVGIAGGVLGVIAGAILFPPYGAIIGAFAGALLAELALKRQPRRAARAGLGALLGVLGGSLAKFAISVTMIFIFTAAVF